MICSESEEKGAECIMDEEKAGRREREKRPVDENGKEAEDAVEKLESAKRRRKKTISRTTSRPLLLFYAFLHCYPFSRFLILQMSIIHHQTAFTILVAHFCSVVSIRLFLSHHLPPRKLPRTLSVLPTEDNNSLLRSRSISSRVPQPRRGRHRERAQ